MLKAADNLFSGFPAPVECSGLSYVPAAFAAAALQLRFENTDRAFKLFIHVIHPVRVVRAWPYLVVAAVGRCSHRPCAETMSMSAGRNNSAV